MVESHYSRVELCPGHLRYCELSCCLRKVISGGRGFLGDESGTLAWCSWRTFGILVGRLGTRPLRPSLLGVLSLLYHLCVMLTHLEFGLLLLMYFP